MKLAKSQLKNLIKEQLDQLLNEEPFMKGHMEAAVGGEYGAIIQAIGQMSQTALLKLFKLAIDTYGHDVNFFIQGLGGHTQEAYDELYNTCKGLTRRGRR